MSAAPPAGAHTRGDVRVSLLRGATPIPAGELPRPRRQAP